MAGRTARELLDAGDVVFLHEARAELRIIGGPLPGHVEDLGARPDEVAWIPVTIEAPVHRERRVLVDQRHLVHRTMTGRAADSLLHVNAVVEVHEVRQIVHTRPFQGRVVAKTRPNRLENGGATPDLRMAIHAGFRRRDVREGGLLDRRMAIPAIDPHAPYVVGVAELDRLFDEVVLPRVVARQVQHADDAAEHQYKEEHSQNAEAGVHIAMSMEDLAHVWASGHRVGAIRSAHTEMGPRRAPLSRAYCKHSRERSGQHLIM